MTNTIGRPRDGTLMNRAIVAAVRSGDTVDEVARRFHTTRGRVLGICAAEDRAEAARQRFAQERAEAGDRRRPRVLGSDH